MPNTNCAEKALRQNIKRRAHNRTLRSTLKTFVKKVRTAVAEGKLADAQTLYNEAAKKLDQSASKKLIHKNAASRTKARLTKLIKSKQPQPAK